MDDNDNIVEAAEFVYSVSDAYPDLLPAWRIKRRYPSVRWIAGYYLFIPHPFHPDNPYKGSQWLRGVAYWMLQIYSYRLVRQHADYVFVTSEPDVARFVTSARDRSKIIVIRGGVDVEPGNRHFASGSVTSVEERDFDACFLGRFHYQKGVLELMDIWKMVMEKRPGAKLVVIGEGPLEKEMREKIATCGMKENVAITGFLDGEPKYEIFRDSRIMVHPATYDSGGMAAAEGMAWALPGVSFDLEALKTYYPKGMLKTQPGNLRQFADNILRLLEDRELYDRTAREARDLVLEQWDWNKRADDIYDAVFGKA